MMGRGVFLAGVIAVALALSGCASPDPVPAQSALATAPGIQGADVVITHPGAPWNTEAIVTLYVADESVPSVAAAVRSAAKALDGGPVADHPVTVFVIPGKPSDYSSNGAAVDARLRTLDGVADALGLHRDSVGDAIRLKPDDIRRLAREP
jgi:hypothetical protein